MFTKRDGQIDVRYLYDDGAVYCAVYNDIPYWYNTDIRGSVTNILKGDATSSITTSLNKSYVYDAYGNTNVTATTEFRNSIAYTGAVFDQETGLYYLMSRYYDPAIAQFISEDSYRGDGEHFWNLYAYCSGDPVNNSDRDGQKRKKIVNHTGKIIKYFYERPYLKQVKKEIIKKLNPGKYKVKFRNFKRVNGYGSKFKKTASYVYGKAINAVNTVEYITNDTTDADFKKAFNDNRGLNHIKAVANIASITIGALIDGVATGILFGTASFIAISRIRDIEPKLLGMYTCYTGYVSFGTNEFYFKYYRDPGGLAKDSTSTISFVSC